MSRGVDYDWRVIEQDGLEDPAPELTPVIKPTRPVRMSRSTCADTTPPTPSCRALAALMTIACGTAFLLFALVHVTQAWTLTPTTVGAEIGRQLRSEAVTTLQPISDTVAAGGNSVNAASATESVLHTVAAVDYDGDIATVEVIVARPGAPGRGYQEIRFMRKEGTRWIDTIPQADYWGDPREDETAYLRFVYQGRDAAAVEAAMPRIDAAYATLRAAYGLTATLTETTTAKVTVTVHPQRLRAERAVPLTPDVRIPSPKLLPIPLTQDEATVMTEQAIAALARRTMAEVTAEADLDWRWHLLEEGLITAAGMAADAPLQMPTDSTLDALILSSNDWFYGVDDAVRTETAVAWGRFLLSEFEPEEIRTLLAALHGTQSWSDVEATRAGMSVTELEGTWQAWLTAQSASAAARQDSQ